jgi:hypothetical protein
MIRRLLFVFSLLWFQPAFALSPAIQEWEDDYNKRIDAAVALNDINAVLDGLSGIMLDFPAIVKCSSGPEELFAAEGRIVSRITTEFKRRPGTISYLELRFKNALRACLKAEDPSTKADTEKELISALDRISCVYARLPAPEMMRSLKNILEEHDQTVAAPYFTPIPSGHLERTVLTPLIVCVRGRTDGPSRHWELDQWRAWFKEAETKGLTFQFDYDSNIYDLSGKIHKSEASGTQGTGPTDR